MRILTLARATALTLAAFVAITAVALGAGSRAGATRAAPTSTCSAQSSRARAGGASCTQTTDNAPAPSSRATRGAPAASDPKTFSSDVGSKGAPQSQTDCWLVPAVGPWCRKSQGMLSGWVPAHASPASGELLDVPEGRPRPARRCEVRLAVGRGSCRWSAHHWWPRVWWMVTYMPSSPRSRNSRRRG